MAGPSPHALRVSTLSENTPTAFSLRPDAQQMADIAARFELLGLRKLSFSGEVEADGSSDWLLRGHLGATVVQPCSVTLAPVSTRLEEKVMRRFTPHLPDADAPEDEEVEMPEDESLEQLGAYIDPVAVMEEALALALPLYPRAEGAELAERNFTRPGEAAMIDEDVKPFAGLADLMALKGGKDSPEDGGSDK